MNNQNKGNGRSNGKNDRNERSERGASSPRSEGQMTRNASDRTNSERSGGQRGSSKKK